MNSVTTSSSTTSPAQQRASGQAFGLLHLVFALAPVLFGLDKFVELLADWSVYLAPEFDKITPGSADTAMLIVGVIEIVAGVLVAVAPRLGGYVVAAWLAGIILNLVLLGDFYDVALRDFGLLVGALALARLAVAHTDRLGPLPRLDVRD